MLFVIDDDSTTRMIVSEILGPKCRAFESAEAFLASDPPPSGVLVLDYLMEGMTGLELHEQPGPRYHIVFLSGEADIPIAAQAFRERCVDFLTKPVSTGHLVQAVGEAIRAHKRVERAHGKIEKLTPRELEVARLVAQGFNNHHVGAALGTSHKTVENQKREVLCKTGADSAVELAEILNAAGGRTL